MKMFITVMNPISQDVSIMKIGTTVMIPIPQDV